MIKLSIKRPILVIVAFLVILIIGVVSYTNLSVDMYPNIEIPMITITTVYPGASSIDVEEQITKKIESAVSVVSDIKNVTSNSRESVSTVTVSFEWGKDLEEATNDIRTRIDIAKRSLPTDAENPIIFKFSSSSAPVAVIGVVSKQMNEYELTAHTERYVLDRFRQVKGVGNVFISSDKKNKFNVNVRIPDLIKYNLPIERVITAIQAQNLNIPLGEIRDGKKTYSMRVPGEYESIEDILNTTIGSSGRNPIFVSDVADVDFSGGRINSVSKVNGLNGIVIIAQKQVNANTINVMEGIKKKIEESKSIYPQGTEVLLIMDSAAEVKESIANLSQTVLFGFIFVVLVVFLFLRSVRSSLIIALSIPFSLIFAFIYLYFSGNTINIISLASLSIAIGMVVDNSIVVLENIFRHKDEGKDAKSAALEGANEVVVAITASTLTTVAIFIPLLFITGFVSVLFKQLAFTVSTVLFASILTSVTLTPMLTSRLFSGLKVKTGKFHTMSENLFKSIESFYVRVLEYSLKNKKFVLILLVAIFVSSLGLMSNLKTEFIAMGKSRILFSSLKFAPGQRIEVTDSLIKEIGKKLKDEIPAIDMITFYAGTSSSGGMGSSSNQYTATMIVALKNDPKVDPTAEMKKMRGILYQYPEVNVFNFSAAGPASFLSSKAISVEIYGEDLDSTFNIAYSIRKKLEDTKGFVDITVSRDEAIPDVSIVPSKERMVGYGMNTYLLMSSLRNGLYGSTASVFRKDGYEYDIFVSYDKKYLQSRNDLCALPVFTPTGAIIPLNAVADIEMTTQPTLIERKDKERVIKVESNLDGVSLSEATVALNRIINDIVIPQGVRIYQAGDVESQKESFSQLLTAILLGLLLVFLVMAGQFESFIDPFVVIFSIPFAFTGVIWALFLTNTTLSVMAFIGMLMLVGIVVNNAIVLIDYMNQLRTKGMELNEAIFTAGRRRLRPVLMTALTTIFGLMPLALSTGTGSEMWRPLGIVVLGGLTVSTVVTLVIIPIVYSIAERRIKRKEQVI